MKEKEYIDKLQNAKLTKKFMLEAIKLAKETKSAELAYQVACTVNIVFDNKQSYVVRRKMEKIVLESKDAKVCAVYAGDVPGANKKALKKVIVESKDYDAIIQYANVNTTDKKEVLELQKVIIGANSAKYAFMFYEDVAGAELKPLLAIALQSKDKNDLPYLLGFREYVKDEKRTKELSALNFAIGKFSKTKKRKIESDELVEL